jgi:dolichyl-phosphate beta-glucosyltransferase
MADPYLSVVIPAYNEALRVGSTLEKVCQYLQTRNYETELILVDDGSSDDTPQILEEARHQISAMRVFRNEPNRGKGYSVRRGVLEARGKLVLFSDADLSAPIEEANKLIAAAESEQADVVVGSRALDRRLIGVRQPRFREFSGRLFNVLVRALTGLKIHDTQCGFKLFRRATTRRAFELQRAWAGKSWKYPCAGTTTPPPRSTSCATPRGCFSTSPRCAFARWRGSTRGNLPRVWAPEAGQ